MPEALATLLARFPIIDRTTGQRRVLVEASIAAI
jgi:hypothetical protein